MKLRAYAVNVRGRAWETVIYALSAGKAKYQYLLDVQESWEDISFKDLSCHAIGSYEPLALRRTALYRGVEFVRAGMAIEVGNERGLIVGVNSGANFDVLFPNGSTLNCHPRWQTRYFAEDGTVLADFRSPA